MANLKNTKISDTGFLQLPAGTTAERPANPQPGMARINTDIDNVIEFWNGDDWVIAGDDFEPIQATGGTVTDIIDNGKPYRVHTFTPTGTSLFTVLTQGTIGEVDVLVVAGGGGGATTGSDTAGGGAGGLIFRPNLNVSTQSFSITVGNGGDTNNNGQKSTAFGLTAVGGGRGSTSQTDGVAGGSGGGAGRNSGVGGDGIQPNQAGDSGTFGFGNRGGTNTGHSGTEGMGGGGAGEPAEDAINILAENRRGGDGLFEVTASDGPYDRTYNFASMFGAQFGEVISGQSWFAGGGGGGGERGDFTQNVGGLGGGGRGGHLDSEVSRDGAPGKPNTGGGGGGSDNNTGGAGGSGIVIVRYPLERVV